MRGRTKSVLLSSIASSAVLGLVPSHALAGLQDRGMSYMSFDGPGTLDSPASQSALISVQQLNVNTVALNVWDFTPSITSTQIAPDLSRYSSTLTEVQDAINYIHGLGMNVMLKPNLDVEDGTFRGNINPGAANANAWFTNYQSFIDSYATLAQQNINNGVTMLSIGTELSEMEQYSSNWTSLISNVRGLYSGKLTYAANWAGNADGKGGYNNISWWNQLDDIGIDAYFPLTGQADPTEAQLQTAWQGVASNISSWRTSAGLTNKNVLFTEAGYTAQSGTNEAPYSYNTANTAQDIQEQANSYQALMTVMSAQPWWNGVFWWDWTQDPVSSTDNGYTPANKPQTLSVLKSFYAPTWNGAGADNNLSTAGNWGGIAPVSAAPLTFAGTTRLAPVNNYAAQSLFGDITFANGAGAFVVSGNSIDLAGNIINNSSTSQTISLGLVLQQNISVNTAAGNVVLSSPVSGNFSLTKTGNNTLTLSAANSFGDLSISAGTLTLASSASITSSNVTVASGATFNANGVLSNTTNLSVNGTANFAFPAMGTTLPPRKFNSITLAAPGKITIAVAPISNFANGTVLITNSLSFGGSANAWQGLLDLTNNDAIIHGGSVSNVMNQIKEGYNGRNWGGSAGITSSSAPLATAHKTALGYELNNNGSGGTLVTGFESQVVTNTDVLLKYTLIGDTNLDGAVNFQDLLTVAQNYNSTASVWNQGDFNYDGKTNFTDLLGLAQNYNQVLSLTSSQLSVLFDAGGSGFAAAFAQAEAQVSVPESTALGLLVVGAWGVILPRRRRLALR